MSLHAYYKPGSLIGIFMQPHGLSEEHKSLLNYMYGISDCISQSIAIKVIIGSSMNMLAVYALVYTSCCYSNIKLYINNCALQIQTISNSSSRMGRFNQKITVT